ncbi:hypothetical protein [Paenisporosarcina sp. OV554]|uniref:hypothetical protein n=1 Tax=Paenisporosarcina sp. OV554 TaxID=2135694 RepID=UPI000D3C608E|nr:hypothetical protein [Paenisporosarcina sp. OV554]PUB15177.1 hypothetical protein C8K15_10495 [Paenisporosarcina sp. OV554]
MSHLAVLIKFSVRPEYISDDPEALALLSESTVEANVNVSELTGSELMVYSTPDGQQHVARVSSNAHIQTVKKLNLHLTWLGLISSIMKLKVVTDRKSSSSILSGRGFFILSLPNPKHVAPLLLAA